MEGKRLIRTLRLKNLLSYSSEGEDIELQPLNVLIGANASGKSNLIEAIGLLRATPKDLAGAIRRGGGVREWLWKGSADVPIASIEASVSSLHKNMPLQYQLLFTTVGQRLEIVDEVIEVKNLELNGQVKRQDHTFYQYKGSNNHPHLPFLVIDSNEGHSEFDKIISNLVDEDGFYLKSDQSILSQIKAPASMPEITYLGNQFDKIRIYRTWDVGYRSKLRQPQ